MKSNGNRYSPAFKFRVVLEALKAEGKEAKAQVARAYGVVFRERDRAGKRF